MATYTITDSRENDWNDELQFKYRYESRDGYPCAQDEVERRRNQGLPVFLWKWENFQSKLIEHHNER